MSIRLQVFWSALRHWGVRLGSVAVFFALARILPKEQLGLFSAAIAVIAIAEIFAENGLGEAVVQAKEIDDEILSAAALFNVGFSIIVAAACLIFSAQLEAFLGAPGLTPILSVALVAVLINALSYIPQSVLRRNGDFRWLAMRGLIATLVSGAVGVGLALLGFGAMSMAAQLVLFALINAVMVWWRRPWTPRPASPARALPLVRFGSKVFASRMLDYVGGRSIELFIVAALGPAALALYIMGSRIYAVLMQLISAVTIDVSMPHFSRLADDRPALVEALYKSFELTSALAFPIFVMLGALAPEITDIAFGRNGHGSEAILLPLSLLGAFRLLQYYNGTLLNAVGRPGVAMVVQGMKAIASVIVLSATYGRSLQTIVLAFSISHAVLGMVSFAFGRRKVGYSLVRLLKIVTPFALSAFLMFGAIWALRPYVGTLGHSLPRLVVLGAIGGAVYLASAMLFNGPALRRAIVSVGGRRVPAWIKGTAN